MKVCLNKITVLVFASYVFANRVPCISIRSYKSKPNLFSPNPDHTSLKLVDLVLVVTKLLQRTRQLALVLGADLGA